MIFDTQFGREIGRNTERCAPAAAKLLSLLFWENTVYIFELFVYIHIYIYSYLMRDL